MQLGCRCGSVISIISIISNLTCRQLQVQQLTQIIQAIQYCRQQPYNMQALIHSNDLIMAQLNFLNWQVLAVACADDD